MLVLVSFFCSVSWACVKSYSRLSSHTWVYHLHVCVSVTQMSHLQNKELAATQETKTRGSLDCVCVCVCVCINVCKRKREIKAVCVFLFLFGHGHFRLLISRDSSMYIDGVSFLSVWLGAMEASEGQTHPAETKTGIYYLPRLFGFFCLFSSILWECACLL